MTENFNLRRELNKAFYDGGLQFRDMLIEAIETSDYNFEWYNNKENRIINIPIIIKELSNQFWKE